MNGVAVAFNPDNQINILVFRFSTSPQNLFQVVASPRLVHIARRRLLTNGAAAAAQHTLTNAPGGGQSDEVGSDQRQRHDSVYPAW
jgi:hypothetical protein